MSMLYLCMTFMAGIAIGALYFGGLWWTVQRLPRSRNPSLLMLVSFLVRTGAAAGCFILIMGNKWEPIAAGLLGFVVIRIVLVRRVKAAEVVIRDR